MLMAYMSIETMSIERVSIESMSELWWLNCVEWADVEQNDVDIKIFFFKDFKLKFLNESMSIEPMSIELRFHFSIDVCWRFLYPPGQDHLGGTICLWVMIFQSWRGGVRFCGASLWNTGVHSQPPPSPAMLRDLNGERLPLMIIWINKYTKHALLWCISVIKLVNIIKSGISLTFGVGRSVRAMNSQVMSW